MNHKKSFYSKIYFKFDKRKTVIIIAHRISKKVRDKKLN
jgi:hypothetical protein